MNKKDIYIILTIVKNNGDAQRLIRAGLSYKQIADITNYSIKEKLIEFTDENRLFITEKGDNMILELNKDFKIRDKNMWIEKENKSRIPRLEKDFVYLPNQNEIHF